MSGVVKGAQKVLKNALFPKKEAPAAAAPAAQRGEPVGPAASIARGDTPEKAITALRRRRGSRTLLSQERMDAELGLGGGASTLGGE